MVTVYTKEELAKAIENKTTKILCKGDVANEIIEKFLKRKRNRLGIFAGLAMIAAGTVSLPFTGGMSAAGIVAGASIAGIAAMTGLTLGPVEISTKELAIICGTIIAVTGILKNAKVKFNADGSVEVEPKYKE